MVELSEAVLVEAGWLEGLVLAVRCKQEDWNWYDEYVPYEAVDSVAI